MRYERKHGWQGHQISFQTAAQIAGALSHTQVNNTHTLICAQQEPIQNIRNVPWMMRAARVAGNWIYFVPSSIARIVKLTINQSKTLTLKVFGTNQ